MQGLLIDGEVDGMGRCTSSDHNGRPCVEVAQSSSFVDLLDDLGDRIAAGYLAVGLDIINGDHRQMLADACE